MSSIQGVIQLGALTLMGVSATTLAICLIGRGRPRYVVNTKRVTLGHVHPIMIYDRNHMATILKAQHNGIDRLTAKGWDVYVAPSHITLGKSNAYVGISPNINRSNTFYDDCKECDVSTSIWYTWESAFGRTKIAKEEFKWADHIQKDNPMQ